MLLSNIKSNNFYDDRGIDNRGISFCYTLMILDCIRNFMKKVLL